MCYLMLLLIDVFDILVELHVNIQVSEMDLLTGVPNYTHWSCYLNKSKRTDSDRPTNHRAELDTDPSTPSEKPRLGHSGRVPMETT